MERGREREREKERERQTDTDKVLDILKMIDGDIKKNLKRKNERLERSKVSS